MTTRRRPGTPARLDRRARAVVLTAIGVGAGYLLWRVLATRTGTQPILFWRLWVAEAVMWVNLVRYAFDTWSLEGTPRRPLTPQRSTSAPPPDIDVVVVCRTEPVEVVRAALVGTVALTVEHRCVVVDTVGRSEVVELAGALGLEVVRVGSVGPNDPTEAALGAIAHLLHGELVTVLAADEVPLPHLLDELVGDFEDPTVWLAQGRQAVYGPSPGEYPGSATEQELFFRVVQAGKNSHGAAYWCGAGGLVRRSALDALGGVPDCDAPGFRLSIAARAQGWRSTYHTTAVALTLARADLDGFIAQRGVWAQGNVTVLRTRQNPLWAPGLTMAQRASFAGSIITTLSGLRRLALMWILCAVLVTGSLPVRTNPVLLGVLWGTWMLLGVQAARHLGRGVSGAVTGVRHRWLLTGAYCTAWLSLLVPRRLVLALRNPPRVGHLGERSPRLRLLVIGTTLVAAGALWRLGSVLGLVELPTLSASATVISLGVAGVFLAAIGELLWEVLVRPRPHSPRFAVEATAELAGRRVPVLDLSEGGAQVQLIRPLPTDQPLVLTLLVPCLDGDVHRATVAAEARWARRLPAGGWAVGLRFTHLSPDARSRITEFCRILLPARDAADAPVHDDHRLEDQGEEVPQRRLSDSLRGPAA